MDRTFWMTMHSSHDERSFGLMTIPSYLGKFPNNKQGLIETRINTKIKNILFEN
jgi:hypothetical protein